jgi:hypothetical protein
MLFWERVFERVFDACLPAFLATVEATCLQLSLESDTPLDPQDLWERTAFLRRRFDNKMRKTQAIVRWALTDHPGAPRRREGAAGERWYRDFCDAYVGPASCRTRYVANMLQFRSVVDYVWAGEFYWGMWLDDTMSDVTTSGFDD